MSRIEALPVRPPEANIAPKKIELPLSFVPRERQVPSGLKSVAGHELNHALVALAQGASITSLSVIRDGDSLGRTFVGGMVSSEAMKVIAAGGGVSTHEGSAEGYGSDKFNVDVMHHFHGGHSWESAKAQAASAISMYSGKVRERAAEIIAYLGFVSGSVIPDILRRAQMELNEEQGTNDEISIFRKEVSEKEEFDSYTVIDTLPDNQTKITYVILGKKEKEELICGHCQRVNAHSEKCPMSKLKEKEDENLTSSEKPFPKRDIIFVGSKAA